jgi:lactate permease
MWQHDYTPLGGSLAGSALAAALPIFVLLVLIGVLRKPSWMAALSGLGTALVVALFAYRMPVSLAAATISYGAAFGLFPIGWIILWAIVLYKLTAETGQFEILKDSIGSLTSDLRLQALLIAFAFGAFIEGAAGFGTPVAVAAAMLTGLGFSPFYAAGICLLANTAPVAFGSIGIPLVTLQAITGLPMMPLSGNVGRICAPISLIVPSYLVLVMGGVKGWIGVAPAALLCGVAFAAAQFSVSSYIGPYLTDIIGSLSAIVSLVVLLRFWQPRDEFHLPGEAKRTEVKRHATGTVLRAWMPYLLLVAFVLLWGAGPVKSILESATQTIDWPGLHKVVQRMPPVTAAPSPYAAQYKFDWLAASGTACMFAAFVSALMLGVSFAKFAAILRATLRQLALPLLTVASVLALAFLMNYSGATATLGLAFAATGAAFPFFSALLGWLAVFLTGSDTSANALFGNLQVVTAQKLGLSPTLMAASNSSGGVMGKMISLQSIAVAAAATGMAAKDESRLFRFTLRHSVLLACLIGLVVLFYAYVRPDWAL